MRAAGMAKTYLQGTAIVVIETTIGHMIPGGVRHVFTAHVAAGSCTVCVKHLRGFVRHAGGSSRAALGSRGEAKGEARL